MNRNRGSSDPGELGDIAQLTTPALDNMAREAMTASSRTAAREILRKRERAIASALRRYLQAETLVAVQFRRPWWIPKPLYRRLLRSISIEERATR